jgi:hypothetical protein
VGVDLARKIGEGDEIADLVRHLLGVRKQGGHLYIQDLEIICRCSRRTGIRRSLE